MPPASLISKPPPAARARWGWWRSRQAVLDREVLERDVDSAHSSLNVEDTAGIAAADDDRRATRGIDGPDDRHVLIDQELAGGQVDGA